MHTDFYARRLRAVRLLLLLAAFLCGFIVSAHAASDNLLVDTDFTNYTPRCPAGNTYLGERWRVYRPEYLKVEAVPAPGFAYGHCLHLVEVNTGNPDELFQLKRNLLKDDWYGQIVLIYQFDVPEPDTEYTFSVRGHGRGSFALGMSGLPVDNGVHLGLSDPFTLTDQDQNFSFTWRTPPADARVESLRLTIRPTTLDFNAYLGDFRFALPEHPETGPAVITPLPLRFDRTKSPIFAWKISDPDGIAADRFIISANARENPATTREMHWDGQTLTYQPGWPAARYALTVKVFDKNGNRYTRNELISLERELSTGSPRNRGLADLHLADPVRQESRHLAGNADWQLDAGVSPLLQSVTIAGACASPHVWSDANGDFTSAKTLAASVVRAAGAKTDREKALACWHWTEEHIYEGASICNGTWLQSVNSFGGGCCGDFSRILTTLLLGAGLRTGISVAPGHVINTTWWDGKPHHFDGVERLFYPTYDGTDIASLADIKADPRILYRNTLGDGTSPWAGDLRQLMHVYFGDMKFSDATAPRTMDPANPEASERIAYDLRDGESFTLLGGNDGIWTRGMHGEAPDYANGLFTYTPDFANASWKAGLQAENLHAVGGSLAPKSPGKATLVYERKSPYNIASAVVWGTFTRRTPQDSIALYISRDPDTGKPRTWRRAWQMEQTGTVPVSIDLRRFLTNKAIAFDADYTTFGYQLRFEINTAQPVDVALRNLKIVTYTQHTAVTVPQLASGQNLVHFNRDGQSGPVTVTWTWHDAGGFTISNPDPAEGDACTLTARVTNRGQAAARNVLVRFLGGNSPRQEKTLGEQTIPLLAPGQTATVSIPWVATPYPSPTASSETFNGNTLGNRHAFSTLLVRVDPDGKVAENDEYDNEAVMHVQVREKADLVINPEFITLTPAGANLPQVAAQYSYEDGKADGRLKDATFSFNGAKPERVRVRMVVRNHCQSGEWLYVHGSTAQHVVVRFYDGDPDKGGRQIGADQVIPAIAPMEHNWAEVEWPTAALTGAHKLVVQVNPDHTVPERDDTPASNRAEATVIF